MSRSWHWHLLTGEEKMKVILVAVVAVIFLGLLSQFPYSYSYKTHSFGPEWDCMSVPKGEPICVKRVAPQPNAY